MLKIKNWSVNIQNKQILQNINLSIPAGEIHVIMGPNGSGKSSLAKSLAGDPNYQVAEASQALLHAVDITNLAPEQRCHAGLFLGFQYPLAIPGMSNMSFLREIAHLNRLARGDEKNSKTPLIVKDIRQAAQQLKANESLLNRDLNQGFSGGEKKLNEILQMLVLKPKLALLDEIDSGLDVDALRNIANAIQQFVKTPLANWSATNNAASANSAATTADSAAGVTAADSAAPAATANATESAKLIYPAVLLITHYQKFLDYLTVDGVHVMINGCLVESGQQKLADAIAQNGYAKWRST